jgi:hypothetical protein
VSATYSELHERFEDSLVQARILCARSAGNIRSAAALQVVAREAREAAVLTRRRRPPTSLASDARFVVRGMVDGLPSVARWSPTTGLDADPAVRQRAEIVVALGESSAGEADGEQVVASLDGPLPAALLAVVRAFSRVTAVDLVAPRRRPA